MNPLIRLGARTLLAVASSCVWHGAIAEQLFDFNVDTSLLEGSTGSLDFNFNPGPLSFQAADVHVVDFASDGVFGGNCPCGIGAVAGQLPAALQIGNAGAFNDYFDSFRYGRQLSFRIAFDGPAVSAPDGSSGSGSTFAFSLFSDTAGLSPALTSNADGFAVVIDLNLDGTTSVTNFSAQTVIAGSPTSAIPEPNPTILLFAAVATLLAWSRSKGLANASACSPSSRARNGATLWPGLDAPCRVAI